VNRRREIATFGGGFDCGLAVGARRVHRNSCNLHWHHIQSLRSRCRRIRTAVIFPRLTFYGLRHTAASTREEAGVHISEILGHADIAYGQLVGVGYSEGMC
jgi:integrase